MRNRNGLRSRAIAVTTPNAFPNRLIISLRYLNYDEIIGYRYLERKKAKWKPELFQDPDGKMYKRYIIYYISLINVQ